MKIPETSANVGPYYANEQNGQWQQNGVIIDSGVGGGVVGSGDAGVRPVYPVQIPRGHIPGPYVMAGAYYPPGAFPPPQDDFADYMWMENEEEFDKQVMQQLEEEALMEQCIEAMLEDEQREHRQKPNTNGHTHSSTSRNGQSSLSLEEAVSRSTLNPLAAEFVPNRARSQPEEPQESGENKTKVDSPKETTEQTDQVESKESVKQEEPPQPTDPPEVSAADIQPIEDKDKKKDAKKDSKKPDVKKAVKTADVKKTKPIPVKENNKVQKKKEVKEDNVEVVKQPSPPPEDSQSGFKPINYAAAAKAPKPKKPTSPTMETPIEKQKPEKPEKKPLKEKPKADKPNVQRKNSAK